jgi:hypothetical protein
MLRLAKDLADDVVKLVGYELFALLVILGAYDILMGLDETRDGPTEVALVHRVF